jgi:WD40 repeat protein
MCAEVLCNRLDVANACAILDLADTFALVTLRHRALVFIVHNFEHCSLSESFLRLNPKLLLEIAKYCRRCWPMQVLDAARRWSLQSPDRQGHYLHLQKLIIEPVLAGGTADIRDYTEGAVYATSVSSDFYSADSGALSPFYMSPEGRQQAETPVTLPPLPTVSAADTVVDTAGSTEAQRKRRKAESFGTRVKHVDDDGHVMALTVFGRWLVSGSAHHIKLWDTRTWECTKVLDGHTGAVHALMVYNNKYLLSGSRDCTIRVWSGTSLECEHVLEAHADAVHALLELKSPALRQSLIVSGSSDCSVRVWNPLTWECVRTLRGHNGAIKTLVACRGYVISGGFDKRIKVWDVARAHAHVTEDCSHTHGPECTACVTTLSGHTSGVTALCCFGDGERLASGASDDTIRVWCTRSWECLCCLTGHKDTVWAVVSLGDGRLVSGSGDSTIIVWNAKEFRCEQQLEGTSNAFCVRCYILLKVLCY